MTRGKSGGGTGIVIGVVAGAVVLVAGLGYMLSGSSGSSTSASGTRKTARSPGASRTIPSPSPARKSRREARTPVPAAPARSRPMATRLPSAPPREPATSPEWEFETRLAAAFDAYPKLQGQGFEGLRPLDAALDGMLMRRMGTPSTPQCDRTDLERLSKLGVGLGVSTWRDRTARRDRRNRLKYLSRHETWELGRLGYLYGILRRKRIQRTDEAVRMAQSQIDASRKQRSQALARLRGKISPKHYEVFEELERMRKANEEKVLRDIRAGNLE